LASYGPIARLSCGVGHGPNDDFVVQQFVVNDVMVAAGDDALNTQAITTPDPRKLANSRERVADISPNPGSGPRALRFAMRDLGFQLSACGWVVG
jgi:hypothetical protein